MANESDKNAVYVSSVIDLDLWNEARWKGCVYMVDPKGESPPLLGLLFRDRAAAQKIFEGWHARFGPEDKEDEIRISIIEGTVPDHPKWYHVHVSSNLDVLAERGDQSAPADRDELLLAMVSRYHRMESDDLTHMHRFKEAVARQGVYGLMPAVLHDGGVDPAFGLAIGKRQVFFRNAADVGKHDQDSVVFGQK